MSKEAGESTLVVTIEREDDGRWIAEVATMPGVLAYGATVEEAARAAVVLAADVAGEDEGVEQAWADEITRRVREVRSGEAEGEE